MSKQKKIALVAGATGVVGRNLLKYLVPQDDWEIIALSRRTPDVAGEYRHISVDLLDLDDCRAKLGAGFGVTHIFFAAYIERGTLCSRAAFMRSAGMVHRRLFKSTSDQTAPRTSPSRAAVRIANSSPSRTASEEL